jgi:hypothetical protein
MLAYCRDHQLELTRSRAYRKNDQAWIEQKNGAVIRTMVGYGRLEGLGPAAVLARLHDVARYFQPCFKLKSKTREGAKAVKKYHAPARHDGFMTSARGSVQRPAMEKLRGKVLWTFPPRLEMPQHRRHSTLPQPLLLLANF